MAEGEKSKVRLDAFTAKVVPDPKNPGESLLLTGFLGASTDAKQTRIYWDPSLSSYVDIDTADIIHAEPLPKEQSPLGGSYIWVKRSAEVSVSAGGQTTKGKFFQGPVMSAYGGTFGAAAGAGAGAPVNPPVTLLCPPPHTVAVILCHPNSIFFPCVSHPIACTVLCPAPVTVACPVESVACGVTPPGPEGAMAAGAAQPGFVGSYAPHCWYSWDACPTMYGCGPHHTPACPQAPMAAGAIPPSMMCPRTPHHGCPTWIGCATGFCFRSGLGDPCHPFTPARPRCP